MNLFFQNIGQPALPAGFGAQYHYIFNKGNARQCCTNCLIFSNPPCREYKVFSYSFGMPSAYLLELAKDKGYHVLLVQKTNLDSYLIGLFFLHIIRVCHAHISFVSSCFTVHVSRPSAN